MPDLSKALEVNRHYLEAELYQRISASPEVFEFFKNSSLDGIWYWDLENPEHEWMSPRFKALFGYEADEIADTPEWWQANIHPDDLALTLDNLEKHKADPNHPYDQVVRYRHKDGSTVWVRCRGFVIRDKNGDPSRMLGAHIDVTSLKQAEADLIEANSGLISANNTLRTFAATVSHDLKSPLRKISVFSHMLADALGDDVDPKAKQYVSHILTACDQANGIIAALLNFAEMQRQTLTTDMVDLQALANEALESLDPDLVSGASITIPAMPPACADADVVRQIFAHLIGNALIFNDKPNPSVSMTAKLSNPMIEIMVSDNGPGFQQSELDRLFEPLIRGAEAAHTADGHGLGLAICRMAVERHGGEIALHSAPGDGAVVRFTLPACEGPSCA